MDWGSVAAGKGPYQPTRQVRCSCKEMWRNCWPDSESLPQEDLDEEEGQFDLEPPPPKITRYQDAIASLEAVQTFLDSKGHSEEATRVASTMDRVAYFHISTLNFARQSTLEEFFPPV